MRELIINLTNRTLTKIDPGKWMMMMSKLLRTREPDSTATDQQQTTTKLEVSVSRRRLSCDS